MKKKSSSQSAFFNVRVLIRLFIILAGIFLGAARSWRVPTCSPNQRSDAGFSRSVLGADILRTGQYDVSRFSLPTTDGGSALDGFDPNANGAVRVVVVQPDGKILIGGDFTTLSPTAERRSRATTLPG